MNVEPMECVDCAAKPGAPILCHACLHNRDVIFQLKDQVRIAEAVRDDARRHSAELLDMLRTLINTPRIDEFFEAVRNEAAHQVERWGTEHDQGKADTDWYWLLGWLAGKAVHAGAPNDDKRRHHIISSAAVLLNWFRHVTGESTSMRPGIEDPK